MPQYDEIEIEDMTFDPKTRIYSYPCPCGDRFKVSLEDLWDGEDIADCNSCTLYIKVIYEESDLPHLPDDDEDDAEENKEVTNDKPNKETEASISLAKDTREGNNGEKDATLAFEKLSLSSSLKDKQNNNNSAVAA